MTNKERIEEQHKADVYAAVAASTGCLLFGIAALLVAITLTLSRVFQ